MLKIPSPRLKELSKTFAAALTLTVALQASAPQGWYLAGSKPMDYATGADDAVS
jgi:hypothetical protein